MELLLVKLHNVIALSMIPSQEQFISHAEKWIPTRAKTIHRAIIIR